jgi:hypothetical protein
VVDDRVGGRGSVPAEVTKRGKSRRKVPHASSQGVQVMNDPYVPPAVDVLGLSLLAGTLALLVSAGRAYPSALVFTVAFLVVFATGMLYTVWRGSRLHRHALAVGDAEDWESLPARHSRKSGVTGESAVTKSSRPSD